MAGKGHHGGAWKVAYADFVTAMMAFFLVMWITAQSKSVKEAVANYFENPPNPFMSTEATASKKSPEPGRKAGAAANASTSAGTTGIGGGPRAHGSGASETGPKRTGGEGLRGIGPTKAALAVLHDGDQAMQGALVVFGEESADLTETGKKRLDRLMPLLVGKRNKIELRGHATGCPLPPDSPYKNPWELSYARASAVMKYLEEHGVDANRLRLSQAGTFEPKTLAADDEARAENSRVEIYVLTEMADDLVGSRKERDARFKTPVKTPKPAENGEPDAVHGSASPAKGS
jgi:chemotaxis protein MotB